MPGGHVQRGTCAPDITPSLQILALVDDLLLYLVQNQASAVVNYPVVKGILAYRVYIYYKHYPAPTTRNTK